MDLFKKSETKDQDKNTSKANLMQQQNSENSGKMNEISRKIRINEERSVNIRKKVQMIEHNMLMNQKKLLAEVKYINEEITGIKREIEDLKGKLMTFSHQLNEGAKKEDIQVLEKYINMWEPVNFVTRNEVEKIIDEKLRENR